MSRPTDGIPLRYMKYPWYYRDVTQSSSRVLRRVNGTVSGTHQKNSIFVNTNKETKLIVKNNKSWLKVQISNNLATF